MSEDKELVYTTDNGMHQVWVVGELARFFDRKSDHEGNGYWYPAGSVDFALEANAAYSVTLCELIMKANRVQGVKE